MTFDEWVDKNDRVTNAWYTIAQEFQSGTMEDQLKRIKEVMEESWEGRYYTLTYHDL